MNEHAYELDMYQWGSGNFLNNSLLYIDDAPMIIYGIASPEFTNTMFYSAPEFSTYLNQTTNSFDISLALTLAQSNILMNRTVTNATDAIG
jgi:hypothetical protein